MLARIWAYNEAFGQRLRLWPIWKIAIIVAVIDVLPALFFLAGLELRLFVVDVSVFDWMRNAYIIFAAAMCVYVVAHLIVTKGQLKSD